MPLTEFQRADLEAFTREVTDDVLSLPLWGWIPAIRPAVLSARRRRNILQNDPEPIGDPEYS